MNSLYLFCKCKSSLTLSGIFSKRCRTYQLWQRWCRTTEIVSLLCAIESDCCRVCLVVVVTPFRSRYHLCLANPGCGSGPPSNRPHTVSSRLCWSWDPCAQWPPHFADVNRNGVRAHFNYCFWLCVCACVCAFVCGRVCDEWTDTQHTKQLMRTHTHRRIEWMDSDSKAIIKQHRCEYHLHLSSCVA